MWQYHKKECHVSAPWWYLSALYIYILEKSSCLSSCPPPTKRGENYWLVLTRKPLIHIMLHGIYFLRLKKFSICTTFKNSWTKMITTHKILKSIWKFKTEDYKQLYWTIYCCYTFHNIANKTCSSYMHGWMFVCT